MDKKKVLLVDDELIILEIMQKRITSWGYEVMTAASGKEAISIIKAEKPDIVILDYIMPEMDGIATLEEIRKTSSKLPVVIFTGYYPDEKALEGARKLGVSAFLPKLDAYSDTKITLKNTLGTL